MRQERAGASGLLRRDRQRDGVATLDAYFLAYRGSGSPYRIGEKPDRTGTDEEVLGDGERAGRAAVGQPQPNSLRAIQHVNDHIVKALILDLDCGRIGRCRTLVSPSPGTGCERHYCQDVKSSNEGIHRNPG